MRAAAASPNGATTGHFLAVRGSPGPFRLNIVWLLAGATTTAAPPAPLGVKNSLFWGATFHLQRPYLSIQESSEKNRHIVRDAEKHGESIAPIHIGHLPPRLTGISGPVPARVVKTSFFGSWDSPISHKVPNQSTARPPCEGYMRHYP